MTGFLGTLIWALVALAQFFVALCIRAILGVLWFFWPIVVVGCLIATAESAQAGWMSWLWGSSDTGKLERSLDIAEKAAKVASQAAEAQAEQAAEQARQNTSLAETLSQLSTERTNLADHLHELTTLGIQDSQWAAALHALGPILVCVTVLVVAALALWLTNRPGDEPHADLAETLDLLMDEVSEHVADQHSLHAPRLASLRLGHRREPALVGYEGDGSAEHDPNEPDEGPMPF